MSLATVGGRRDFSVGTHNKLLMSQFSKVRDDDVVDTLIAAIAKPAAPQQTETILSTDIPTQLLDATATYMAVLSIGGANVTGVNHTLNYRPTKNGVDVLGADQVVIVTANLFWAEIIKFADVDIAVGDVLGFKLWADVANVIDWRYLTLYLIPRTLTLNDDVALVYGDTKITGAVAGVTYGNNIAVVYKLSEPSSLTSPIFLNGNNIDDMGAILNGMKLVDKDNAITDFVQGGRAVQTLFFPEWVNTGILKIIRS